MLYLGNASSPAVREAIRAGEVGMMCSPAEGRSPAGAQVWAADNGCYSTRGYPGDTAWLAWLTRHATHARRCLFATAPDIVADAAATLTRSALHLPAIRALGFAAALAAQDGLEQLTVPWDEFDVLFLGGTTTWKLGPAAGSLAAEAIRRGLSVHMGRVNSARRWRHAARIGCGSVDGTHLAYAPDADLADLRRWANSAPASSAGRGVEVAAA